MEQKGRNILSNYFESRPMVQEMSFLRFYCLALLAISFIYVGHFVQQSTTICTILVESIMKNICEIALYHDNFVQWSEIESRYYMIWNIHVKLFCIWISGAEDDA